jgi:hypothetical protein
MKKSILIFLSLFMMFGLVFSAFATSSDTATLGLTATINSYLTVSLDTATIATTLTGNGTGASFSTQPILTITSNIKSWKVTFASTNGNLKSTDSETIPYTVMASGGNSDITNNISSAYTITSTKKVCFTSSAKKTKKEGVQYTLTFAVPDQAIGTELYTAQAYTDTLTITIATN